MRRRWRDELVAGILAVAVAGIAGLRCEVTTTSGQEGISCRVDGDCPTGLLCLDYAYADGGYDAGCAALPGKECLRPCQGDTDCASADGGLSSCVARCSGASACAIAP